MKNKKFCFGMMAMPAMALALAMAFSGCASGGAARTSYALGETGPGGGFVFYAENGTYMECSPELGQKNWADAQNAITKYRGGRKKDWRAPTAEELELIYTNLKLELVGGFSVGKYWTAEEDGAEYAFV